MPVSATRLRLEQVVGVDRARTKRLLATSAGRAPGSSTPWFGGGMRMLDYLWNLFKPGGRKRIDVTFTEEELEAIRKHGEQINSFAPEPGQVLYVKDEMVNPLKAFALVEHVAKQMAFAHELPEEETGPLLDKVIATQAKACVLHELPYYLYLWATLNEAKGDMEAAKRLFALFLKYQAEFKPGKVDGFIIRLLKLEHWYDVEKAIREARTAVGQ
jgi:hypothetical protein